MAMNKQTILTYLFRIVIGLMIGTIGLMIFGTTRRAWRNPAKSDDNRSLKERAQQERRAIKTEGPGNTGKPKLVSHHWHSPDDCFTSQSRRQNRRPPCA